MTTPRTVRRRYLLRELNIFGLDHLDPIILAALADGQPLLLVGAHGTAKSELLNRIATALGLVHRHYNASLISFDDLLGYPVPNESRTGLEYLRTPGDLWDAESVFLDEISRCRPEHQNKLFSIIHERRIQGLLLEKLRYRWSAMNPPLSLEGDDADLEPGYQGSLPLDVALADRFAYIASVPSFTELTRHVRGQVIAKGGDQPVGDAGLPALIGQARSSAEELTSAETGWIADYVNAVVAPLRDAQLAISGRRAVSLARCVSSVFAAQRTLGRKGDLADAAFLALKWGLPQRVQGLRIQEGKVIAVHKAAVKTVGEPVSGIWTEIREEANPVRRVALALEADEKSVSRVDLSQLVTDAWAGLSVPERYVFARNLLPALHADRLTTSTYELLLEPATKVLAFTEKDEHQHNIPRGQTREWDQLLATVSRLQREGHAGAVQLGNILYTLFVVEGERFEPNTLVECDSAWHSLFRNDSLEAAA